MRRFRARFIWIPWCLAALACSTRPVPPLESEQDETLYAVGAQLALRLAAFDLDDAEVHLVAQGLRDRLLGKPLRVDPEAYGPRMASLMNDRLAARAQREKLASRDFLERAANQPGAEVAASGLIYTEIAAGTGPSPSAKSVIRVRYLGTLQDGTVFDRSAESGEASTLRLAQTIPCWQEGLLRLRAGGKARLVCPSEIAYGDQGVPGRVPPGAALAFEVELVEVREPPAPPSATSPR